MVAEGEEMIVFKLSSCCSTLALFERGLEGRLEDLRWESMLGDEVLMQYMEKWRWKGRLGKRSCSLLMLDLGFSLYITELQKQWHGQSKWQKESWSPPFICRALLVSDVLRCIAPKYRQIVKHLQFNTATNVNEWAYRSGMSELLVTIHSTRWFTLLSDLDMRSSRKKGRTVVLVLIGRNNLSTPLIIQPCNVFDASIARAALLACFSWHYNNSKDYHEKNPTDAAEM